MEGSVKHLESLIKEFESMYVAVVGDPILDKVVDGKVRGHIPAHRDIQDLSVDFKSERYFPGGAANTAKGVFYLGARPTLYGPVGSGFNGEELRRKMHGIGKFDYVLFGPGRETIMKETIRSQGNPVVRLSHGDVSDSLPRPYGLSREQARSIVESISRSESDLHVLMFSDYDKGTLDEYLSENLIKLARNRGAFVSASPKPENLRLFAGTDLIVLNREESERFCTMMGYGPLSFADRAKLIRDEFNVENVVITLGEEGMLAYNGRNHIIPSFVKEAVDTTGAGDMAFAALSLALARGADIKVACHLANCYAGLACEKPDTYVPGRNELIERVKGEIDQLVAR